MKKTINPLTASPEKTKAAEALVEHVMVHLVDIADDDDVRDFCYEYADGDITKANLIKLLNIRLKCYEDDIKDIKSVLKEAAKDIYPKKIPQVVFDLSGKAVVKKTAK